MNSKEINRLFCMVDYVAERMKEQLGKKYKEGYVGWDEPALCPTDFLYRLLLKNISEKKWVHVMNLAAMIYVRESGQQPILISRGRQRR